jgi:hypothetical protein
VEGEVTIVREAEPEPLMDVGLNVAEALAGKPLSDNETEPEKPFRAETVVVKGAEPPAGTDCAEGVAAMEKSAGPAKVTASRVTFPRVRLFCVYVTVRV